MAPSLQVLFAREQNTLELHFEQEASLQPLFEWVGNHSILQLLHEWEVSLKALFKWEGNRSPV